MGIPSYASPMLALMRDTLPSSAKSYTITDELDCAVDGALARLCKRDQQMGDMVWLTYSDQYYFQTYFDWRQGDLHTISKATPTTAEVWRKFYINENALGLVSSGALLEFGSNGVSQAAESPALH